MAGRPVKLAKEISNGDRHALAMGISLVENEPRAAERLLRSLKPPGRAFVLGVTGPPGTGKSTLVDRLIDYYLGRRLRVGVIAVDPSSPLTGGALLGDRIRMSRHADSKGVFIRSMASRGWSGGLTGVTSRVVRLMDAARYDVILIETVGIGQSDIEVVGASHAVLVVLMPGLGDDIQVSKAGLMEIGDVYAVNKSDLDGADAMVVSLLSLARDTKGRAPSVLGVSALNGEGLEKLEKALEEIRKKYEEGSKPMRLRSIRGMIMEAAKGSILRRFEEESSLEVETLSRQVLDGRLTIEDAASRLARGRTTSSQAGRT